MIRPGYIAIAGQVVRVLSKRSGIWAGWSGCGLFAAGQVPAREMQGFASISGSVARLSGGISMARIVLRACVRYIFSLVASLLAAEEEPPSGKSTGWGLAARHVLSAGGAVPVPVDAITPAMPLSV